MLGILRGTVPMVFVPMVFERCAKMSQDADGFGIMGGKQENEE